MKEKVPVHPVPSLPHMKTKEKYSVIGLMSGTSLDGLDIACCLFERSEKTWRYSIEAADTMKYPRQWLKRISNAHTLNGEELIAFDIEYGKLIGGLTKDFIDHYKLKPDFIASHGHTVFHQPARGFTYQAGNGNAIHAITDLPVVFDFRSQDVILGGQGAPLVPAGDKFLFSEYDICLNLGGIANLSLEVNRQRKAFDICFTNMGLNYLAAKAGKEFDKNGKMAESGEVNQNLLRKFTKLYDSIEENRPSLGRELFEKKFLPLLDDKKISIPDKLRTLTESSASAIVSAILERKKNPKVLCTGGGAFNTFLISRMLDLAGDDATLILPEENIIKFKEALVFAFLGLLRVRDEVNCLKSVTGATRDTSAGVLAGF
jgi:anhydro-N-acetylmuramic acid kinase